MRLPNLSRNTIKNWLRASHVALAFAPGALRSLAVRTAIHRPSLLVNSLALTRVNNSALGACEGSQRRPSRRRIGHARNGLLGGTSDGGRAGKAPRAASRTSAGTSGLCNNERGVSLGVVQRMRLPATRASTIQTREPKSPRRRSSAEPGEVRSSPLEELLRFRLRDIASHYMLDTGRPASSVGAAAQARSLCARLALCPAVT